MTDGDVDEVAVDRACAGDTTVSLTRTELLEAFRRLNDRGVSGREIARRLGVTDRTVFRWRTGTITPYPRDGRTGSDRRRDGADCDECGRTVSRQHMARHRRRMHSDDQQAAS